LFDLGEASRACAVLLSGRADVPPTAIELRNQFDFSASACRGIDTSATRPPVDTVATTHSVGEFTVQVAAYDVKAQADRLATRLRGQGLEARVIGKKKPFRVRVGHYMTHAEAYAAMKKIDAIAKSSSFVVLIGPEEM
jgi:cell division protein FtsN